MRVVIDEKWRRLGLRAKLSVKNDAEQEADEARTRDWGHAPFDTQSFSRVRRLLGRTSSRGNVIEFRPPPGLACTPREERPEHIVRDDRNETIGLRQTWKKRSSGISFVSPFSRSSIFRRLQKVTSVAASPGRTPRTPGTRTHRPRSSLRTRSLRTLD
jgi:hypothetical protein